MLYGRGQERRVIDRLLAKARDGRSGALLIRGEVGIGKSALLRYAARPRMTTLETLGLESEAELPFAGLHLLLRSALEHIDRLPPRQAEALRGAFGMEPAAVQDRYLAGLAALTLLSELGDGGSVVCLIDDAQWLDGASVDALMFAARRLDSEGIAMIFAAREEMPNPGIPELHLAGLADASAEKLLSDRVGDLSLQVRRRIVEEAEGNPLALLELLAALTEEQRQGCVGPLPYAIDAGPPTGKVQQAFQAQIGGLPDATQAALLVAAADDTGNLTYVLRAAERFGGSVSALAPAERAGLIHLSGSGVAFRHPLIRTAAYQVPPHHRRVAAHLALAETLAGDEHADRRAWHRAASATGPDEEIAGELERAAVRARERQGVASASAAFERAAELTADAPRAARWLISAAELAIQAGQLERAVATAERAMLLAEEPDVRAGFDRTIAAVEFERGSPSQAGQILVEGAGRLADMDQALAMRMLADAVRSASFDSNAELAREADRGLKALGDFPLARGMAVVADLLASEDTPDLTPMRDAIEVVRHGAWSHRLLATSLSLMAGENNGAYELSADLVDYCREQGMIGVLPEALIQFAQAQIFRGRLAAAAAAAEEALVIAQDVHQSQRIDQIHGVLAWLAGAAGDDERCLALAEKAARGVPAYQAMANWALGLLHLGHGRPQAALEHFGPMARKDGWHPIVLRYAAPDLVEAAVRAEDFELATWGVAGFEEWSAAVARPWAAALAHRCHALLPGSGDVEEHYERALHLYDTTVDQPFQHARTELVYGEWLRRQQRRSDARQQLRAAFEQFDRIGAASWAQRARTELEATGESAASATGTGLMGALTPREQQVVRLAAQGLSNREIGAQLFLSPRTVGHHLYKAFPKLGVTTRAELTELDDLRIET